MAATKLWAAASLAAATGLLFLIAPPKRSLGRLPNIAFAALIALALVAFLPSRWFPLFDWRSCVGETWSSTASHGQRATVAHVSINASISSWLELGLLSAGSGLEFGRAQESVDVHRLTDRWSRRGYHSRQFFTGTNSLLAAHARVRIFS